MDNEKKAKIRKINKMVQRWGDVDPSESPATACYVCGADQSIAKLARMLGHRPDVAFAALRKAQRSFESLWDSLTDILSQEQIDRIERLHKDDLNNLFMDT